MLIGTGERVLYRPGQDEMLAEQADRIGIRNAINKHKTQKLHDGEPVPIWNSA